MPHSRHYSIYSIRVIPIHVQMFMTCQAFCKIFAVVYYIIFIFEFVNLKGIQSKPYLCTPRESPASCSLVNPQRPWVATFPASECCDSPFHYFAFSLTGPPDFQMRQSRTQKSAKSPQKMGVRYSDSATPRAQQSLFPSFTHVCSTRNLLTTLN